MILRSDLIPYAAALVFARIGAPQTKLNCAEALHAVDAGAEVEPGDTGTADALAERLEERGMPVRAAMFRRWGRPQPEPIATPLTQDELDRIERELAEQDKAAAEGKLAAERAEAERLEAESKRVADEEAAAKMTKEADGALLVGGLRTDDNGATWTEQSPAVTVLDKGTLENVQRELAGKSEGAAVDPNAQTEPPPAGEQKPAGASSQPPAEELEKPAPELTDAQNANVELALQIERDIKAAKHKGQLAAIGARVPGFELDPKWDVPTIKHKLSEQVAKNVAADKPAREP